MGGKPALIASNSKYGSKGALLIFRGFSSWLIDSLRLSSEINSLRAK